MKKIVLSCIFLLSIIIAHGKEKIKVNVKIVINDEAIFNADAIDDLVNNLYLSNKKVKLASFNVLVNSKAFNQRISTGKKGKIASIVEKQFSCDEILKTINQPMVQGEKYIVYFSKDTKMGENIPREMIFKPFNYLPDSYEEIIEKINLEYKMATKFEKKNTHLIFYLGDTKETPSLTLEGAVKNVSVGETLKFNYAGTNGNISELIEASIPKTFFKIEPEGESTLNVKLNAEVSSDNISFWIKTKDGCESNKIEVAVNRKVAEKLKSTPTKKTNNVKKVLLPCEKISPTIYFDDRFNYDDSDKGYYHWFDKANAAATFNYILYPKEVGSANYRFYVKSCAAKYDIVYYGWDEETSTYQKIFEDPDKSGYPVEGSNGYFKLAIDDDRILLYPEHKIKIISYDSNGGKREKEYKVAFMDCNAHD